MIVASRHARAARFDYRVGDEDPAGAVRDYVAAYSIGTVLTRSAIENLPSSSKGSALRQSSDADATVADLLRILELWSLKDLPVSEKVDIFNKAFDASSSVKRFWETRGRAILKMVEFCLAAESGK